MVQPKKIGRLENASGRSFSRDIDEIPDLIIDFTPDSGTLRRRLVHYQLSDDNTRLLIEVWFCETGEYRDAFDPDDESKMFGVVQKNLQRILPFQQWEARGFEGVWSAVE